MTVPRFERSYELAIGIDGQVLIVRPPFRIAFDAVKSIFGGVNRLNVKVWNLKSENRLKVVKDAEDAEYIPVSLKVGYGQSLETVFKGSIHRGAVSRQAPDTLVMLECLDGGRDFLFSFSSQTVSAKAPAIDQLIANFPNLVKGRVTNFTPGTRPKVLFGNTAELIRNSLAPDETFYIDDEEVYIIKADEYTREAIPLVNSGTGLMATPERKNKRVTFQTLLNPVIKIGARVQLESITAGYLNGVYRVEDISYKGDYEGADWSQVITGTLSAGFRSVRDD